MGPHQGPVGRVRSGMTGPCSYTSCQVYVGFMYVQCEGSRSLSWDMSQATPRPA